MAFLLLAVIFATVNFQFLGTLYKHTKILLRVLHSKESQTHTNTPQRIHKKYKVTNEWNVELLNFLMI